MKTATLNKTDSRVVELGITKDDRSEMAQKLTGFLASTYLLYVKTLYYHWNVTGPQFHALHTLFEEQYEDLHAAGDTIAERIRALGHFTPGTLREFMECSSIEEDRALPENSDNMVKNLLRDNEQASREAREVQEYADKIGDEVTADIMIARMQVHDKAAWMLRATSE